MLGGKRRSPLISHAPTEGLIAALHVAAFLSVFAPGAMGKVYGLLHLLNTNLGIRKIRYLVTECLILNIEMNQLELVQPLMCLIKPSSALQLDPGPKNDFVFFFK